MNITLLGPQRRVSGARSAVPDVIPEGPIATINAGWQERESDTRELDDVLGGRMVNLELHRRWLELTAEDPAYADAEAGLTQVLDELRTAYRLRLHHALTAVTETRQRVRHVAVREVAEADALREVCDLDHWHRDRSAEARETFYGVVDLGGRESVQRHRAEIAGLIRPCTGLVVTGGHVGVLLHLLHVFGLVEMIRGCPAVVAWSAGAMALSEQVVLFHDRSATGALDPETYAYGLGVYRGVVAFPHPKRRLRLDDHDRLALLVRRFAPDRCVLLGEGVRLDLDDGVLPADAPVLGVDGRVRTVTAGTTAGSA